MAGDSSATNQMSGVAKFGSFLPLTTLPLIKHTSSDVCCTKDTHDVELSLCIFIRRQSLTLSHSATQPDDGMGPSAQAVMRMKITWSCAANVSRIRHNISIIKRLTLR